MDNLVMREIKFRAWDRNHMHMWSMNDLLEPKDYEEGGVLEALLSNKYEEFYVSISHVGVDVSSQEDYLKYRPEDFTLMQYTGLKDKNGVEIYDGDIIKYFGKTDAMHFGTCTTDVRWDEYRCGFAPMSFWVSQTGRIELEVIGNIYENPDLLKKTE